MKKLLILLRIISLFNGLSDDVLIELESIYCRDDFISFNITINSDVSYIDLCVCNSEIEDRVYFKKNVPILYSFMKSDFVNGKLSFVINQFDIRVDIFSYEKENKLNEYCKSVYYNYYFFSNDNRCRIINNINKSISWDNASNFYESSSYYIDLNDVFKVSYSGNVDIYKAFLVLNEERKYFKNLEYSIKYHGCILDIECELENGRLFYYFECLYYDNKSFQLSNYYLDKYMIIDRLLIPKGYRKEMISLTMYLVLEKSIVLMNTNVYVNDFYSVKVVK